MEVDSNILERGVAGEKKRRLLKEMRDIFQYHPPTPKQVQKMCILRERALDVVEVMVELCPLSHELDMAIDLMRQALGFANAAISNHDGKLKRSSD